jgi:hypothetical protein
MTVQDNLRISLGMSTAATRATYHADTSALASAAADTRKKILTSGTRKADNIF